MKQFSLIQDCVTYRSPQFFLRIIATLLSAAVVSGNGQTLLLPSSVVEGAGTLTNRAELRLSGSTTSNLQFTLQSSWPALVSAQSEVNIQAGQSNVYFNLTVGDNLLPEGTRTVVISATSSGGAVSNSVSVLDNDPYQFTFSSISSPQATAVPFSITLVARGADGSVVTNFTGSIVLNASGLNGGVPVEPANVGPFVKGQWTGSIQVTAADRLIRLGSPAASGQSNPFHVEPPPFRMLAQPASDIAWQSQSQTLFATVPPSGGVYSNKLIAIDPFTGIVTNAYSIGEDPSQLEISPTGQYLYAAISNRNALRKFNLNTRQAGIPIGTGSSLGYAHWIGDMTIPGGASDSVVAALSDLAGNSRGIWRYDSGSPVNLVNFSALDPYNIEASTLDQTLYGYQPNNQFPLMRGLSQPYSSIFVTNGILLGSRITYRDGVLYDNGGRAVNANTFAILGDYLNVIEHLGASATVEVDPMLKRTYFLTAYANFGSYYFFKVKAYERDTFLPIGELSLPLAQLQGGVGRLLRCGTNGLVVNTGSQIWFIQSNLLQPSYPPANLILDQTLSPLPILIGSNANLTLSVSNSGPGIATFLRISNSLPANVTISGTTSSTGSVTQLSGKVLWELPLLEPGSNATLQVQLCFGTAGWTTNVASVVAYESDPSSADNVSRLGIFTQIPSAAQGIFEVLYPSEDLVYDPGLDRLLLSVSTGVGTQSSGIALLDPYNGTVGSFVTLEKNPAKLLRSGDGQQLYVSLKQDALIRRLSLPTLSSNLQFSLGAESWNGVPQPYYAADMAILPGQPESLAVWRVRAETSVSSEFGRGIAIYDNGVMRSNVTDSGGNWTLEFNPISGTLFGYNSGDLRRCAIDANGVSFIEQYPTIYGAGNDVEFSGGKLFSSAGRLLDADPVRVRWQFAGAQGAGLVEPDAANGRVFFLVQDGGWKLKAYDIESRCLIGSLTVPNLAGTPSSLIRWGTNGLAFRTSGGQLYVVRSALIQPSSCADLALSWSIPAGTTPVDGSIVTTLTVTNAGPAYASGLRLTNSFSAPFQVGSLSASTGTVSTNGAQLVWSIPGLNAGSTATLTCPFSSSAPGAIAVTATAIGDQTDAFMANNSAVGILVFGDGLTLSNALILPIVASDVVWSPANGKLLLTGAAGSANWTGSLISIDPISFQPQLQAALGSAAGRLAISRDNTVLYAGVDSGVSQISLTSGAVVDKFLVQPYYPVGSVFDLDAAPGSNQLVVVGSKSADNNSTWVGAYDSGIYRTNIDNFYSGGIDVAFGDSATMVFGKDYSANGFRRYNISPQGLTLLDADTGILPTMTAMELVWGAGKFFSSSGQVINPTTRTLIGTIQGIPAGSQVFYDAPCDRAFFFSSGSGQAVLRAFDGTTLLPVGIRTLSGVTGTANGFVRWGLDGFAATMSSGQTLLFRSGLVATNPPADVSISTFFSPSPYFTGSNIVSSIVISNAGPNPATDIAWSTALPVGATLTNVTANAGSTALQSNVLSGVIPSLSVGASAFISFTLKHGTAGILTNQATVIASSLDPVFTNNIASANLWIQSSVGLTAITTLTLPVRDLERDPLRPLLYVCFGSDAGALADSIVVIDPINGQISAPLPVGSNPGKLAASPDGQFLYVALDGSGVVQKRTLPDLTLLNSFPIPQSQQVVRMTVSPTNADMVAIRRSGGKTSLHVGGVQLPGELTSQDLFAFSETSGSLFGCVGSSSNVKLYRLNTGTGGLALLEGQPGKQSSAIDLKSSGGLLFFNRGMVVNPDTTRVKSIMPVPANSVVEPDTGCGRVFYLTPLGSTWTLRAFDIDQAVEVGSLALPTLTSAPRRLLRWGADGLAFYNTNSQLVLVRGRLVPTNSPVDLVLKQSINVLDVTTNDIATVTLQLTNLSAQPASGVVVTQRFSSQITNVVLSPATGSATYTNGVISWQIGNLAANAGTSLSASFRPRSPGTLTVSSVAAHELNDPFWGNNTAMGAINVLGSTNTNVLQLQISVRDLVYDAFRNLIYASVPASNGLTGNLVIVIDPTTGEMRKSYPAGSEPNQMALSDDGRFLHVAQDGAVSAKRFDLQGLAPDLVFPLGTNDLYYATDLESRVGQPETVAATLASYNFAAPYPSSVAVYDLGVARPGFAGPAGRLAFAADCLFGTVSPGVGAALVRMWPTNEGFLTENVAGFSAVPNDIKLMNGR